MKPVIKCQYIPVLQLCLCPQAFIMLAAFPEAQTLSLLHQYQIHILTWNSGIVINPATTWDDIFLHWVPISGRTKRNSDVFKFLKASLHPVSWVYFNMKISLTRIHFLLGFQVFFSFSTWYTQPWADLNTYTKIYYIILSFSISILPFSKGFFCILSI